MYYIYSDEAGTSAYEPVTVVVGIIFDADRHWRAAEGLLEEVKNEFVPKELRDNFIFHATDVLNKFDGHKAIWPREARVDFIAAVAAIPRILGAAVALGRVRRDAVFPIDEAKIKLQHFQHLSAFGRCMARANKYVRDWGGEGEVATVIAENVDQKKHLFKEALRAFDGDIVIDEVHVKVTEEERRTGRILQTNTGPLDRIIDTVHFVDKSDAPLLQVADACAFCFRRYFAEQSFGSELISAMLGDELIWDEWQGPSSNYVFSFHPDRSYPKG